VPVVAGAVVAGIGFDGSGVCCAPAIPEHSARASADSASVVFKCGMRFLQGGPNRPDGL
jgi:hypothetical protein